MTRKTVSLWGKTNSPKTSCLDNRVQCTKIPDAKFFLMQHDVAYPKDLSLALYYSLYILMTLSKAPPLILFCMLMTSIFISGKNHKIKKS